MVIPGLTFSGLYPMCDASLERGVKLTPVCQQSEEVQLQLDSELVRGKFMTAS